MAKSAQQPDSAAVLAGLRKALAGRRPLHGPGSEPLFSSAAAGKKLAEAAIRDGFLERVEEKPPGKKKPVVFGMLTEKGRNYVLEVDSPKAVLEALLPAVQALSAAAHLRPESQTTQSEAENAAPAAKAIEAAFARLQQSLQAAWAKLEKDIARALPPPEPAPAVDAGLVLAALRSALDRAAGQAAPAAPALPAPAPSPVAPPATAAANGEADALGASVVAFVTDCARRTTVGCTFDTLMDHLAAAHPGLTVGTFHDVLRALHRSKRIRLGGWNRMHDELPNPELALFLSNKVMYYAHPAQHHG